MNLEDNFGEISAILIAGIIGLIVFACACIAIVPAGHVGVHDLFGDVKEREYEPGFYIIHPFASLKDMSIKTQEYTMSSVTGEGEVKGADSITTLTKEGLTVNVDLTLLYSIQPEQADVIYTTVGLDYKDVLIRPNLRSVIREVIANYEAKEIYSEKRSEIESEILTRFKDSLSNRGIIIENIMIRDIRLPQTISDAIEAKLTAEQEIEKRSFDVEKEKQEADRKRIEAQGIADANEIIATSLTSEYLTWYWIEGLDSHESVIYVPISSDGVPLFKQV